MAGPGRQPKLTPAIHTAIVSSVRAGVPYKYAADGAGISPRTMRKWMAAGKKAKKASPFAAFYSAVKKAESVGVTSRVRRIIKAAKGGQIIERITTTTTNATGATTTRVVEKLSVGQWTADAWMLERRYPDEFAANRKKDIEDAVEKIIHKAVEDGTLTIPGSPNGPPRNPTDGAAG